MRLCDKGIPADKKVTGELKNKTQMGR